ncbi:hypothetical protein MASR1M90_16300 [Desulfovibrionales bacterium]
MKRLLCVLSVFFVLASAAHAATPGQVHQLLILGNHLNVLERSMAAETPLAAIVVDPSITGVSAALFGLTDSQVALFQAPAPFGQCADLSGLDLDTTLPLYVLLGTDPETIWATAEAVLTAKPELIYAVMKGQTALLGAVIDASTGAVTFIGTHPDLLPMAARHILGQAAPAPEATENAEVQQEEQVDAAAPVKAQEQAEVLAEQTPAQDAGAAEAPAHGAEAVSEAPAQSGGMGGFGIVLFIVALIGTVILMDKTVLKS